MTTTARLSTLITRAGFSPDMALSPIGIGMDSLDYVEFSLLVEQEFGVTITDEDLYEMRNRSLELWVEWVDREMGPQRKIIGGRKV